MREKNACQSEMADIRTQLSKIDARLNELSSIVRRIASRGPSSQLETLSAISLNELSGENNRKVVDSILPSWSSKTLGAVRELRLKGTPATAALVASITKKRRNTESARLTFLASSGLVQRRRNGRNVLYLCGE